MEYGKVSKGYKQLRRMMQEKAKYVADCKSCRYYYGEPEECNNTSVTQYDMCEDGGRLYCIFWLGMEDK